MSPRIASPPSLHGLSLAVAGAGVLGLSIAALAARAGAAVTVFDPRPLGDNASGVAAGMLAPALETALDPGEADHALLAEGYAAWPAFAAALGLPEPPERKAGALYLDAPDQLDRLAARLADLGADAVRLGGSAARALQPALTAQAGEALYVGGDGRLDPTTMLQALAGRLRDAGGTLVGAPAPSPNGFDAIVLAGGYEARGLRGLAPELEALQPIKGHVLHFDGGPGDGATVRGPAGYAAPQARGVIFGATMEPGRDDLELDPAAVAALHLAALDLLPGLAETPFAARTGVRAATPSGRPMVGRSVGGVHLAVGARRNGWLLAPLIAAATVQALAGGPDRPEFALPPA